MLVYCHVFLIINTLVVNNPFKGCFKDFLPDSRFVLQIIIFYLISCTRCLAKISFCIRHPRTRIDSIKKLLPYKGFTLKIGDFKPFLSFFDCTLAEINLYRIFKNLLFFCVSEIMKLLRSTIKLRTTFFVKSLVGRVSRGRVMHLNQGARLPALQSHHSGSRHFMLSRPRISSRVSTIMARASTYHECSHRKRNTHQTPSLM